MAINGQAYLSQFSANYEVQIVGRSRYTRMENTQRTR